MIKDKNDFKIEILYKIHKFYNNFIPIFLLL